MSDELIAKARAGDGDAFRELIEPYRRELQVHCYRMLGSLQDAEDALQDSLLAAWRGLESFEGRASVRTWLYQIVTRRCLNALRATKRRSAKEWDMPFEPPKPSRLGEIVWLEPYPDALLKGATDLPAGPEAKYEQTEAISLAFVVALQVLPARQRAVLILRDVLGYHADQVATMLGATVQSANSLLKRARATLARHQAATSERERPPVPNSPAEKELVAKFVRAYESGDVDALVALLTADVHVSMPPVPLEWHGIEAAEQFYAAVMASGRKYQLVPTRANGQIAFGAYLRGPGGISRGAGLLVVTLAGDRISDIVRFENSVLEWFGLPRTLES